LLAWPTVGVSWIGIPELHSSETTPCRDSRGAQVSEPRPAARATALNERRTLAAPSSSHAMCRTPAHELSQAEPAGVLPRAAADGASAVRPWGGPAVGGFAATAASWSRHHDGRPTRP